MALWQEIKIEPQDRRLLIAFGGSGLAIMAIGGLFALLMLLVRTPAFSMFSSNLYYQAITGHSLMMFIFWLGFIQTAFLIAAGTVLIQRRLASYKLAWTGWALMVLAALMALIGVLRGASVSYHALLPLSTQFPSTWQIYLSFLLLALGMSFVVVVFITTIIGAVERRGSLTSWAAFLQRIPIATFAAMAGLFIAIPGLIAAFKVFSPALILTLQGKPIDSLVSNLYRMNWHIVFHIYHYIPALALVGVAYILVEATTDAKSVYAKQVAKALFLLYPFFVPPTFIYHLLVDPNLTYTVKFVGSSLSLLVGVPTVLHMFIILGMLEARMRRAGYGFFSWFRHLPWGNPVFGSMIMGMVTLFVGGLLAYVLIQEQLAPTLHNTFVVPAYIHPMAAGGANIMYMGALYYGVPVLLGRRLWGLRMARIQPYLMGAALVIMSAFGAGAGLAGVPRRYASLGPEAPASWSTWMNLSLGVGGILAIIAGVSFILIMGMTIIAGKKVASVEEAIKGIGAPALPTKVAYGRTIVALIPSSVFIVGILVLTLIAFGHLWGLPIRFQVR
ncbi:MAG: cbb3-type cytochrome c oxidase subunit I [Chloroflexi bacterium]|nr:cbb3-type cytochrome c oxidase subunit I [Chloroflexota bacterium]